MREDYLGGLAQLRNYLDQRHTSYGVLVLFSQSVALYSEVSAIAGAAVSRSVNADKVLFTVLVRAWKPTPPSDTLPAIRRSFPRNDL